MKKNKWDIEEWWVKKSDNTAVTAKKDNATTRFQKWKSLAKDNKNGYNIEDKGSPQQPFVSSPKGDESTRGTSFFSIWKNEKWYDIIKRKNKKGGIWNFLLYFNLI